MGYGLNEETTKNRNKFLVVDKQRGQPPMGIEFGNSKWATSNQEF